MIEVWGGTLADVREISPTLSLGYFGRGKNPKKRYPRIHETGNVKKCVGAVRIMFGSGGLLSLHAQSDNGEYLTINRINSLERAEELLVNAVKILT